MEQFFRDPGCSVIDFLADRNVSANLGGILGEGWAVAFDGSAGADGLVTATGLSGIVVSTPVPRLALTATKDFPEGYGLAVGSISFAAAGVGYPATALGTSHGDHVYSNVGVAGGTTAGVISGVGFRSPIWEFERWGCAQ